MLSILQLKEMLMAGKTTRTITFLQAGTQKVLPGTKVRIRQQAKEPQFSSTGVGSWPKKIPKSTGRENGHTGHHCTAGKVAILQQWGRLIA